MNRLNGAHYVPTTRVTRSVDTSAYPHLRGQLPAQYAVGSARCPIYQNRISFLAGRGAAP